MDRQRDREADGRTDTKTDVLPLSAVYAASAINQPIVTNLFSGPGKAIGLTYVSRCLDNF